MKKILTVFALIILAGAAASIFTQSALKKSGNLPVAGGAPEDFVLGVSSSVTYRLSNFLGKRVIVLAFLDDSVNSRRFEQACEGNLRDSFAGRPDLIWFNIKKENYHSVVREKTKIYSLMYRTLSRNIPGFYDFSSLPSVLLIDKTGVIKLIYNGYSPTIFTDIKHSLPEAVK
jgi:hypothetical protein